MRLWSALLLIIQIAHATNRVVVTFDTMELATRPYDIANATVVKQYGRRMVLDLGREAKLPEAWLGECFGVNITVELDALVLVSQWDDEFEDETTTEETTFLPETTPAPNFTPGVVAQNYGFYNSSSVPWNLADSEPYGIHAEGMWKTTNSTPDVYVAVLDTGLAQVARGAFLNLAQGYDFVSDESISLDGDGRDINPTDPGDSGPDCPTSSWHGTKVMSILAADHRNAFGVLGVAQNASIIPIRVLGQCSAGYANDITDAIVWAAGGTIKGVDKNPNPAKIISMSFAGSGSCPSYLQSAINQAVGLGAFLIAAAGNEGLDSIDDTFPANCNNVLSVGASTRRGNMAAYSNKGADIAAPGGDGADPIHVLSVRNGNLSNSYSMGTSMAVPHVAGVAGLFVNYITNVSSLTIFLRYFMNGSHLTRNISFTSSINSSQSILHIAYTPITCPAGQFAVCSVYWGCLGCGNCPSETYKSTSNTAETCTGCSSACSGETYEAISCTSITNRVCLSCTTACTGDTYQTTACTSTTNRVCSPCTATCTGDTYQTNACTSTTNRACSPCTATCTGGTYQTSACTSTTNRVCSPCTATCTGDTYQTSACTSTTNRVCSSCTSACTGETYQTTACTSATNRVCTACRAACEPGTYQTTPCASTTNRICTSCRAACEPGTYETTPCTSSTNRVCMPCAPSTFSPITGSTSCLSCTVCDGLVKYQFGACSATSDTVCCNSIVGAGTYANSCGGTISCPVLANGNYINSGEAKLNRCMDFTCNAGYYASPMELAKASTLCQSSNYILSTSCTPYVNSICVPVTTCPSGISTVLRTTSGVAILNSTNNDVQCTKCAPCMPGTVQISPCTDSTQTVCATCSTTGLYAGFPWNGRCMYYSTTPGTMTVSQTPIGFFPYTLSYSSAVLAAIANNSISYPTKKVDSFTLDPFTYSMTTASLTAGFSVSLNIFIPCAAPPIGRRFKAWSTFQAKPTTPVTCTSITNCANFQAPCDLASSTECTGWNNTLKKGWYASAPGECTLCPDSSSYSTCNWGFYRNLSDCRPDRVSECFPCHGALPPNAVWTTSRSPHYFDDSEPNPCNWDCDKGFFKDGDACTACTKPENSEFGFGPYISFGNTNPPAKTCLDPGTCKYFGGIKGFGCAWKCPNGYKLEDVQDVGLKCLPCPALSCAADEIAVFRDTCEICQKCDSIVAHAVYQPGCTFTCAVGYYRFSSTYCARCSVQACPVGQYSGGCGDMSDSICLPCTQCESGYSVSTPCSASADAVCSACTAEMINYGTYDSNCNVICRAGYVMSAGECKLCAVTDANCFVGQRRAATCTADNLGCEACVTPSTYNWCWSGGIAPCLWDCGPGYRKLNGICVVDASKTANPCLGSVFAAPVATTIPLATTLPSPLVTLSHTSPHVTATTPMVTATTPMVTSTTPNATSTTPNAASTTPNATFSSPSATPTVAPTTTPIVAMPVTRETLTVANLTISQCLCSSAQVAAQLSKLYGTTVLVVSCATDTVTTECTDYVCPCTGNRRRLLQVDVTMYTVAFKRSVEKPTIAASAITKAIQAVIPTAVVTATASEVLDTTSLAWTSVKETASDSTGLVILGFALVLAASIGFAWSRTKRVKARIINLPIDGQ